MTWRARIRLEESITISVFIQRLRTRGVGKKPGYSVPITELRGGLDRGKRSYRFHHPTLP